MTNYSDPFGVQETTPLSRALRHIALQGLQQLNWPDGYTGPNYIASINSVVAQGPNAALILPNATGASEGTGFLIVNRGDQPFNVLNYDDQQIVTTVAPGNVKYLYCEENLDLSGTWRTFQFGDGVSASDAIELAGSGLTALGGKLSVGFSVTTSASDVTVDSSYRGNIIVNTGGSITVNLPQYNTVGNSFFAGMHNAGSGTMTLKPATNNRIDGYQSLQLAPNESVFFFCSGSADWFTIGYGRSTQFQFTKLVKDISAGGTFTLTSAEASNKLLQFIGSPSTDAIVVVPSVVGIYYVQNTYSGPQSLTIKTPSGTGIALAAGDRAIVYCDGVNVVSAQSVAVGANLSIIDGSLNAPAIAFSSDPDTGLYKADLDTVGIISGGQEAARFSTVSTIVKKLLGVGINNPTAAIHLAHEGIEALKINGVDSIVRFNKVDGTTVSSIQGLAANELALNVAASTGKVSISTGNGTSLAKILEVSSTGLKVNGTITDASGNAFAKLGSNTFTGLQIVPVIRNTTVALGSVSGAVNIPVGVSNTFSLTCSGATTINFTGNPPSGQDQVIYLKVTNGNLTWGTMCAFGDSGTKPIATSNGTDLFAIWYDPETAKYIVGRAYKDYK